MNPFLFRRIRGPVFLLCFALTAILAQWGILPFWRSWPLYLIVAGLLRLAEALLSAGIGAVGWNQQVLPGVPVLPMRRPSVTFALAEFIFGTIALLVTTGVIDREAFWHGYSSLWPLLLVVLGVLLLLERLLDQRVGRRFGAYPGFPRRRRHGGLVFLVILLILLGLSSQHGPFAARDFSTEGWNWGQDWNWNWGGPSFTNDISLNQPIAADTALTIDNARGAIQLSPSTDGQIHVEAHQTAHVSQGEKNSAFADARPVLVVRGASVSLTVPSRHGVDVDLVVSAPETVLATVRTHHGDVSISGLTHAVEVNEDHGDVTLDGISGPVQIVMDHGDVHAREMGGDVTVNGRADDLVVSGVKGRLRLDGEFFGDTSVSDVSGPVEFLSNRTQLTIEKLTGSLSLDSDSLTLQGVPAGLKLTTRSKDVDLTGVSGNVNVSDSNSDVHLGVVAPMGTIQVTNDTGDITLSVPAGASFSLHGQTGSDDSIDSTLPLAQATNGDTKTIQGQTGQGGPHIELTTRHGDISVSTAGSAPNRPAKPAKPETPEKPSRMRHLQTDTDPPSPVVD
jgi:DUF4097 and DUF4098 domain-containing protein YvlB